MPVVDARRGDIYTALYEISDSLLKEIKPPQIIPINNIAEFTSTAVTVLGAGESLKQELTEYLPEGSEVILSPLPVPHPAVFARLATEAFERQLFSDSSECEPRYMRPFQGIM